MPIGQNRYYNDPALGQAFSNLAQAFAPPSGSDLAGYATANAKRAEASRLAQIFAYAQDPNFDKSKFDRMGQAGNLWSPSAGYYGVDAAAQTSRANNAADNQRATLTSLFQPLNQGQVRPAVPDNLASLVALPGVPEAVGAPKPLTESEVQGAERQRLSQDGLLTDQMLLDTIVGKETPVQVVGPDGKTPQFTSPGAAVRTAAQPFVKTGSEAKPTNGVAVLPDGRTQVPAVQGMDGRWKNAQTGEELPQGIRIFDLPKATGTAGDIGMAPTTANNTQANNQEAEVTRALSLLDIYEKTVTDNPGAIGLSGLIRGTAQNAAATANDLAGSFGKSAPEISDVATQIREGLGGIAPEYFDSSIPETEFLQGTLAYSLARTENPSGEVSRQAFDRALDRVKGGGLLANSQSALAAIGANRKVLQTQLEGVRNLRNPGTGRTDTNFQAPASGPVVPGAPLAPPSPPQPPQPPQPPGPPAGGVEQWERDAQGKLRRVQ